MGILWKDLAAINPIVSNGMFKCLFCGIEYFNREYLNDLENHRYDCVWRRAKEKLEGGAENE